MRLVCGVGINDADYITNRRETVGYVDGKQKQRLIWICPYYQVWRDMLGRCYNKKIQEKHPTYKDCTVCEEWLLFSNFKAWMEQQDWEGKHLDKDILVKNSKIYSTETCVFVPSIVNLFTVERGAGRGKWPIGVYYSKESQKFCGQCCNPFTKKAEYLGSFECPNEAHQAWLKRKLELAKMLAAEQDDPRVAKALVERYENYQPD